MHLTFVLGGARSGKTRWALQEARRLGEDRVTWIAAADGAEADTEMARRIARHRAERPRKWQTVEETRRPAAALEAATADVVVLDCLTVLLSSHISRATSEEEAEAAGRSVTAELLRAAGSREGDLLVVSNEVGQGVVPAHPLGRWFRDVQGRANQELAAAAERVVLLVAGVPVWAKGGER